MRTARGDLAQGAWSESLYPGPTALEMIGPDLRAEVEALVPALRADPPGYGPTARRALTRAGTEALVRVMRGGRGATAAPRARPDPDEFASWDEHLLRDRRPARSTTATEARERAGGLAPDPARLRLAG